MQISNEVLPSTQCSLLSSPRPAQARLQTFQITLRDPPERKPELFRVGKRQKQIAQIIYGWSGRSTFSSSPWLTVTALSYFRNFTRRPHCTRKLVKDELRDLPCT